MDSMDTKSNGDLLGKNNPRHSLHKKTEAEARPYIPPHLLEPNWLEYEYKTAKSVLKSTLMVVRPLGKETRVKDIHRIRVCLRRWFSVWDVLKEDGWESAKFRKTMGKELRRLYKNLGNIRDWDVNCKLVKRLELPESVLKYFDKKRLKERKKSFKQLKHFNLPKLLKAIQKYLKARYKKLKVKFIRYQGAREETVFSHFEKFLIINEHVNRELSQGFEVMEDIHNFRLGVKSWRYLLVEFYGVTNLELVTCQKHLGKTVDYDRIRICIEESPRATTDLDFRNSIEFVVGKRNILIKEIENLKKILPFGFRPLWISQGMMN